MRTIIRLSGAGKLLEVKNPRDIHLYSPEIKNAVASIAVVLLKVRALIASKSNEYTAVVDAVREIVEVHENKKGMQAYAVRVESNFAAEAGSDSCISFKICEVKCFSRGNLEGIINSLVLDYWKKKAKRSIAEITVLTRYFLKASIRWR
jgi:hypothetical protein